LKRRTVILEACRAQRFLLLSGCAEGLGARDRPLDDGRRFLEGGLDIVGLSPTPATPCERDAIKSYICDELADDYFVPMDA
jgi:hypothetical protein